MNKINFAPFPILKTERLTLRCLELSDDKQLFSLRSNKIVNKYIVRPQQKDIKEIRPFISKINNGINNNEWIYWVISLKDNPTLIGTICLWNFSEDKTVAEIGYELDPAFQGKGIMSEALNNIIEFGFKNIKLIAIEAYTHKNNDDSTKLLQKYNFIRDAGRVDKENSDNIIFTLTKQNWMKQKLNTTNVKTK
ncbi:MAG: GNAT family protein [Ignavibacteriaceae bacterium]